MSWNIPGVPDSGLSLSPGSAQHTQQAVGALPWHVHPTYASGSCPVVLSSLGRLLAFGSIHCLSLLWQRFSNEGPFFFPGDVWHCLQTFPSAVTSGVGNATGIEWVEAGQLLRIPHCAHGPHGREPSAPNVRGAEGEKHTGSEGALVWFTAVSLVARTVPGACWRGSSPGP